MNDFWYILGKILGIIFGTAIIVTICGYVIMLLWNWLMPVIFGLTTITFWQAIGLDALIGLLFMTPHPNINFKKKDSYY